MLARARATAQLKMVADQRLQPTFTADLAAALVDAVERDARGVLHLTNAGACSWYEFTRRDHGERRASTSPIEPTETTIGPAAVDRPLNGVLARPRADALGLARAAPLARGARRLHGRAGLALGAPTDRS